MTIEDKKSIVKTADTILIEYAKKECRLFCDNQNEPYAKVQVDNHTEIWGVHSQGFGDLLRSWYFKKTKRGVNQSQLDSAIMTISAIANYEPVEIVTPYINVDKSDILRDGLAMGLDYGKTWTCYNGRDLACGKCGACVERLESFAANGIQDPISYVKAE